MTFSRFLCFFCIRNIYLRNTQIIVILMWFIFLWGYFVTNIKFVRFKIVVFLNHILTDYLLAEGIWKVHIFCHLFIYFQTSVYTWGAFIRIGITVLFATVKSTIDTSNSSNTVLLFLRYNNYGSIYHDLYDIWSSPPTPCELAVRTSSVVNYEMYFVQFLMNGMP